MFDIKNLKKVVQFQNKTLLDIDNISFEEGKLHTLRGQNGAGKTTLLHILALVSAPTSGSVKFFNEEIDYSSTKQLHKLRQQIVLMEQSPIMFTGSVEFNICFGMNVRRIDKKLQQKKLDEVLERLEITRLKKFQANTLSGGENQRVALARALVLEPKCLILDEPTASVDRASRELIEGVLQTLPPKISIIMTTHSEEQNELLAQNTITLENGKVIA